MIDQIAVKSQSNPDFLASKKAFDIALLSVILKNSGIIYVSQVWGKL